MIGVLSHSWALMLGMLLLMLGNGLQGTLLGVRGSIEQIDTYWMGYIMSGYFIGFMGGSRLAPWMIRRVGHVRVFAALGSLVSAAFILYAAWVDPLFWFLLRMIVGFCFAGIYVVAESWLNESSTNESRGQALSLYLTVQMAGIVLGQLLLNLASPDGYELFVLITVLVSISFAPILLSVTPAPVFDTSRPMSITDLIEASPLACFGMFVLGGVFAGLFAMAPVYATQQGFSVLHISYFVTSIYLGGMLLQYPIGWMSDRMDRRVLIIGLTLIGGATAAVAYIIRPTLVPLLGIAFVLGGTSSPLYSLFIAYANDFLESEQMASASGSMLFLNGIGAMGGPVGVGYLMNQFGTHAYFMFIALLMLLICAYGIYRISQRDTVAVEDMGAYVPITSRTTAVATEIALEVADELDVDDEVSSNPIEPHH